MTSSAIGISKHCDGHITPGASQDMGFKVRSLNNQTPSSPSNDASERLIVECVTAHDKSTSTLENLQQVDSTSTHLAKTRIYSELSTPKTTSLMAEQDSITGTTVDDREDETSNDEHSNASTAIAEARATRQDPEEFLLTPEFHETLAEETAHKSAECPAQTMHGGTVDIQGSQPFGFNSHIHRSTSSATNNGDQRAFATSPLAEPTSQLTHEGEHGQHVLKITPHIDSTIAPCFQEIHDDAANEQDSERSFEEHEILDKTKPSSSSDTAHVLYATEHASKHTSLLESPTIVSTGHGATSDDQIRDNVSMELAMQVPLPLSPPPLEYDMLKDDVPKHIFETTLEPESSPGNPISFDRSRYLRRTHSVPALGFDDLLDDGEERLDMRFNKYIRFLQAAQREAKKRDLVVSNHGMLFTMGVGAGVGAVVGYCVGWMRGSM